MLADNIGGMIDGCGFLRDPILRSMVALLRGIQNCMEDGGRGGNPVEV